MATDAEVEVILRFAERNAAIRRRVLEYITRVWGSMASFRKADIERFADIAAAAVTGGQVQVANLTDAYLAAVESEMTGRKVRPVGVPSALVADKVIRGVAARDVYRRTGSTVYAALSKGEPLPVATKRGLDRAVSMASTDLQLAKTHATQHVYAQKPHVTGYRRTLTGSKSCGLCIVASTQEYHKGSLLPIHPACDCGTLPILEGKDTDPTITPDEFLGDVHAQINERFGAFTSGARNIPGVTKDDGKPVSYKDVLFSHDDVLVTHQHGELGPILGVRGQRFTGPSDLAN
jgi:hypothetical protein